MEVNDMNESTQVEERRRRRLTPSCMIREEEGRVTIALEMPGVRKENLEIKIEKNELLITGKPDETGASGTYLVRERGWGDFEKAFTLDETIDRETVNAELRNGVLSLSLGLREAAKPKRIEISG